MIVCNNCPWKWRSLPNRLDNAFNVRNILQHISAVLSQHVTTMWPVQLQPSLRNQAVGTPAITIKGHKLQESHLAVSACCGKLGKCQVHTYYIILYIFNIYYNYYIIMPYNIIKVYDTVDMKWEVAPWMNVSWAHSAILMRQVRNTVQHATCLFHGWEVIPQGTRKFGIRHMFSFFKLE